MKKKILLGIAALMIAAAATFHVQNVAFGEKESYATLESIAVMAEAQNESGGGIPCCIGSKFRIDPIPGGWECINNEGNSCCPIC